MASYSLGHATLTTRPKEGALVRKQLVYASKFYNILIFLIKICVDTTIKFLFIRLFDTSNLMKRGIFFLFALDVIAYLFLGYLLVIQKARYLFSVLLLFSNFSVPFIKEKEFELFKNKK